MATATRFASVTGLPAVDRALAAVEPRVERRIVRRGARNAARPVLAMAKRLVPKRTGALEKAIRLRAIKRSRATKGLIGVSVLVSEGLFKGDQFYGGMVELGARWHTSWGKALSPLAPQQFLQKSLQRNREVVMDTFIEEVTAAVFG